MLKDDTGIAKFLLLDVIANMVVSENAAKILNGCLDEVNYKDVYNGAIIWP